MRKLPKTNFASRTIKRVFPNGLTALVQSIPGSSAVSLSGKVRAGECFGEGLEFLPHLAAYQLTLGSQKYSKNDIAELLEDMGQYASLSFAVDKFSISFGGTVISQDFASFLSVAAELLRNPLYADDELSRSKELFADSITQSANDSFSVAGNRLARSLYNSGPYAQKMFAELPSELAEVTSAMLHAFHDQHIIPKSTILTIVGDIESEAAFALIEQVFGDWAGPEAKEIVIPSPAIPSKDRIDVRMKDKPSVDIIIGLPSDLKRSAANFYAARIANMALGGDTISSRLGKVVRVKNGLTYGINSGFEDPSFGGAPWQITLTVDADKIDLALSLIDDVVAEFTRNGITDVERNILIDQAVAAFQMILRTDLAIANTITAYTFLGMDVEEMDNYPSKIKAVTKAEVNEALRRYFRLDQAVTVVCGTF